LLPENTLELLLSGDSDAQQSVSRVYLALLQHPGPSRGWLVERGEDPASVDFALTTLQSRGLVTQHADGSVDVFPPDTALPHAAARLERQGAALRAITGEMTMVYLAARRETATTAQSVQVLHSLDDITRAMARLRNTTEEAKALQAPTASTRALLSLPVHALGPMPASPGRPGLSAQVVYDPRCVEPAGALSVMMARGERGERSRFFHDLPFSLFVAPGEGAVIDATTGDRRGDSGLLVSAPQLVEAAEALADRVWMLSTALPTLNDTEVADDRDRTIVLLLSTGATDAAIARHLGVSQRTVERRVRAILDLLGVTTRFQAGVQAGRRGWI
jgi:DNA-binding CsgD family transcriptional regulator